MASPAGTGPRAPDGRPPEPGFLGHLGVLVTVIAVAALLGWAVLKLLPLVRRWLQF